ncbi:MAG: hypothetical protein ACI89Z_001380 [Porticoccus sp.]
MALSKQKEQTFADAIGELNVVPVAISYELDPLDTAKGLELYAKQTEGVYLKDEHEDFSSIYSGVVGRKGAVHVAFGEPLVSGLDSPHEMAVAIDRQIIGNYHLHPTNIIAYEQLGEAVASVAEWKAGMECDWPKAVREFTDRMNAIPVTYRDIVIAMYANPVRQKLNLS